MDCHKSGISMEKADPNVTSRPRSGMTLHCKKFSAVYRLISLDIEGCMMDSTTKKHLENLRSDERELQNQAFFYILKEAEQPVDWAYEAWDELVKGLSHKDNHVRAISAQ